MSIRPWIAFSSLMSEVGASALIHNSWDILNTHLWILLRTLEFVPVRNANSISRASYHTLLFFVTLVTIVFLLRNMKTATKQDWVLLIHQLPPKPTSLRVSVWRKLQNLGAVSLKNSVYVLPFDEKTYEDFQWLKQEIESAGGEATVFRAGSVEGATDDEIVASFRKARDEDYERITGELEGLTGAIREQKRGGHLSPGRLGNHEAELDRLHAELERVVANDFFNAKGRAAALAAYELGRQALHSSQRRETVKTKGRDRKSVV